MTGDNSSYVVPHNYNNLSHKEISRYVKTVLNMFMVQALEDDLSKKNIEEGVADDIRQYEAFLEEHFISNSDLTIDMLEKRRYTAFESFIDAIDEIQNIRIEDPFHVLYSLKVDCEQACYLLPKYEASDKLLPPSNRNNSRGAHYSRRNRFGHNWPVNEMVKCIERLRDPKLREYLEITDLTDTSQKLLDADQKVKTALCNGETTLTLESLNGIREWRNRIIICINYMYTSIPQCNCSLKDEVVYEAHVIFRDRFIEKEEINVFSVTSYNDLSHSQLLLLAKKYEKISDGNPEFFEKLRPKLKDFIANYQCSLELFKKSIYWTKFEEYEKKLLSTLDMLLCTISLNLRCIVGAEHEQLWSKHYESDYFKTADYLLEPFDKMTYNHIAGFNRGEYITHSFQEIILEAWKNPLYRKEFEALKCVGLLDDCLLYHNQVVKLSDDIFKNQNSSISVLREQRIELCLLLNVLEIVVNDFKDKSGIVI